MEQVTVLIRQVKTLHKLVEAAVSGVVKHDAQRARLAAVAHIKSSEC